MLYYSGIGDKDEPRDRPDDGRLALDSAMLVLGVRGRRDLRVLYPPSRMSSRGGPFLPQPPDCTDLYTDVQTHGGQCAVSAVFSRRACR